MVCCIAAAFVFALFARFFRKIFRRPDPAANTTPPPTPRIEVGARMGPPVPASSDLRGDVLVGHAVVH